MDDWQMSLVLHGAVGRGTFHCDVSLSLNNGDVLAITGANCSGKSTILHTIAGLVPLLQGTMYCNDQAWDDSKEKVFVTAEQRSCAVVFQDLRLFPHMSVLSNVAYGLRAHGVNKQEARARSLVAMSQVGLHNFESRTPNNLSGGEQQRVALARALVLQPHVLLLDEPFTALDANSRTTLRSLMPEIVASVSGVTVLVSHDPGDVDSLSTTQLAL